MTAELKVRMPLKLAQRLRLLAEDELSSMNREAVIAIRAHLDASDQRRKGARG